MRGDPRAAGRSRRAGGAESRVGMPAREGLGLDLPAPAAVESLADELDAEIQRPEALASRALAERALTRKPNPREGLKSPQVLTTITGRGRQTTREST